MKNKFRLPAIIVVVITTLIMITACPPPQPPTVEINGDNLTKDMRTITLCPGCSISLIAEGTGETDLNYAWNLEGVGKLKHLGGDGAEGRRNDYTAPNSSNHREIIEVSVIDTNNQKATDDIIIIVQEVPPSPTATLSPTETATPPATNTPVSPTPTSTASCQPDPSWPTLRILQTKWNVFVPGYDNWFDKFAKEWGCDNDVNVIVDYIGLFHIAYCLEAEIAEYKGEPFNFDIASSCFNQEREGSEKHDLIEMVLPPHQPAPDLVDLTNFMKNIKDSKGDRLPLEQQARICRDSSSFIDEETNERKYIGVCHGWVPELSLYNKQQWKETDFPNGPSTYPELLDGGAAIKENPESNIKVAIPLTSVENDPALDVNNAIRAIFWSFGASVQDENQNVVIDSDETREAIKYIADLFIEAMDFTVFEMNDESNNVCLAVNEDCSYIINAISAYLLAQKAGIAGDIVLAPPLKGPVDALAPPHLTQVYVMPDFINSNQQARAEDFLQAFIMNYQEVMEQSQLYTLSAWPDQFPISEELLDDKTKILKIAQDENADWLGWTRNIGYPGPTNAAVVKVFRDNILPHMVGNVAYEVQSEGGLTDEEYKKIIQDEIDEAKKGICAIFLDPETRPKQNRIEGCE